MTAADDRVIESLTEAFRDDPLYRWLFVDPTNRDQALRHNFTVVTAAALANARLDATPGGDAAAIWTAPGRSLFGEPGALLAVLSRWVPPARLARAGTAMGECSRHQPPDAVVLHVIGVRPGSGGAGLGSALVQPRLVELDRLGCEAYLESSNPRNHNFYARHGFRPIADVRLGDDGPSVTCMVRAPRTTT